MTKASEDDHCKMQYFLGDFDGEKFLCTYPSDEPRWLDEGFDNYAAVTFQNAKDVLLMGWGMNWQYAAQTPTEEYCGQATLARKLSLTEVDGALTLVAAPAGLGKISPQQLSDRESYNDPHRDLWTEGFRKRRCENLPEKLSRTEIEDLCN